MIKLLPQTQPFLFFTLLLICTFLGLGTWQLERKKEKEELLNALATVWVGKVQDVDKIQTPTLMKPLIATGHYLPYKRIFLQAKTHRGQSGVYVLQVFQTQGGKFLLVQRGWSPKEQPSPPTERLRIEGIGRTPSAPTYFQPANKPPVYFWIDLAMLSRELQLPLLPYYLVAKHTLDPHIIATAPFPTPRNNHLEYAITWYCLAFSLLVMLLWSVFKELKAVGYIKRKTNDCTNHNS